MTKVKVTGNEKVKIVFIVQCILNYVEQSQKMINGTFHAHCRLHCGCIFCNISLICQHTFPQSDWNAVESSDFMERLFLTQGNREVILTSKWLLLTSLGNKYINNALHIYPWKEDLLTSNQQQNHPGQFYTYCQKKYAVFATDGCFWKSFFVCKWLKNLLPFFNFARQKDTSQIFYCMTGLAEWDAGK